MVWPTNTKASNYPTAIDRTPDGCHPIKDELFSPGSTLSNLDMALLWRRMSWVFRSTIRRLVGSDLMSFQSLQATFGPSKVSIFSMSKCKPCFLVCIFLPKRTWLYFLLLPGLNLRGKMGPCNDMQLIFLVTMLCALFSRMISQMAMKLLKLPHKSHHPRTHMHQSNI